MTTINWDVNALVCDSNFRYIESEEFIKNQNCFKHLGLRKNIPEDRYSEVGVNLGLHYQSAYDQMQYEA